MPTFLKDSKSFMSYNSRNITGKISFWIQYPRAYYRYIKLMYFDKGVKGMLLLRKQSEEHK